MRNITIRQMQIFESVARHLSFSKAALDLHLTQPAVSMQIRQIENQSGLAMLAQTGKRISLTEAGKLFLRHCRVLLADMQAAEQSLHTLANGSARELRIGLITSASYFFPGLIHAFLKADRKTELAMTVRNREQLITLLQTGDIDLAVMVQPPENPMIRAEPFASNPFVFLAAPSHPLAGKRNIPLSRLSSECLFVRERGTDTRHATDSLFGEQEMPVQRMELNCEEAIRQSVMAGMGISLLSAQAVQPALQAGLLTILDVRGLPLARQWRVAYRADRNLPDVARDFRDFLLTEAAARLEALTGIASVQIDMVSRPWEPLARTAEALTPASANLKMARRTRALLREDSLADQQHIQDQDHRRCETSHGAQLARSSKTSHH